MHLTDQRLTTLVGRCQCEDTEANRQALAALPEAWLTALTTEGEPQPGPVPEPDEDEAEPEPEPEPRCPEGPGAHSWAASREYWRKCMPSMKRRRPPSFRRS